LQAKFWREDFAAAAFWFLGTLFVSFGRAFGGEILPQGFFRAKFTLFVFAHSA
jgi:hypothetical protein